MDKKSQEEKFKVMKLPELKFYLQNRGITVNSYLKPGLVAIACAVEEMNLPVLCETSEADEKLGVSRCLNLHDVHLPDPLKMDVLNDFKHSTTFGLFDIFNYLIYHSPEYDKQGLAAYKWYENYRLFYDGYVESLLTIHRKDAGIHVYVAAALYSLNDLLNTKGEDCITSKPQWIRRRKPDTTPCELKDLLEKEGLKITRKQNEEGVANIRFPSTLSMTHVPFQIEHHVHKNV